MSRIRWPMFVYVVTWNRGAQSLYLSRRRAHAAVLRSSVPATMRREWRR